MNINALILFFACYLFIIFSQITNSRIFTIPLLFAYFWVYYTKDLTFDSVTYAEFYENNFYVFEPAFNLTMSTFASLGFDSRGFIFIFSVINIILLGIFTYSTNRNDIKFSYSIFLWSCSLWGISSNGNAIRQILAAFLAYISITNFFRFKEFPGSANIIIPISLLLLSPLFHATSVVLFIAAFISYNLNFRKIIKYYPLLIILSFLINYYINPFGDYFSFGHYTDEDSFSDRFPSYFRIFFPFLFSLLYIFYFKNDTDSGTHFLLKIYLFIIFLMTIFAKYSEAISRLNVYLWPLDILFFSIIFSTKNKISSILRFLAMLSFPIFGLFNPSSLKML